MLYVWNYMNPYYESIFSLCVALSVLAQNWPVIGIYDGEGNGNPLQYACLENPMDGRAW